VACADSQHQSIVNRHVSLNQSFVTSVSSLPESPQHGLDRPLKLLLWSGERTTTFCNLSNTWPNTLLCECFTQCGSHFITPILVPVADNSTVANCGRSELQHHIPLTLVESQRRVEHKNEEPLRRPTFRFRSVSYCISIRLLNQYPLLRWHGIDKPDYMRP
jgi:hypothetical protein